MTELTAHRTVALREAVANDPDVAFLAALHVLCLRLFSRYGLESCLEIEPKSVMFGHAPGLLDAVREAKGDAAVECLAHLKKVEMAKAAEDLIAGTAWVPEPLRTPGQTFTPVESADPPEPEAQRQPLPTKARAKPKHRKPARAEAAE